MRNTIQARGGENRRLGMALFMAGIMATAMFFVLPGTARAATYYVTNLNNSGAGSLRQAIADSTDGDVIYFAPGLSGTITLSSDLPDFDSVTFVGGEGITMVQSSNSPSVIRGLRTYAVETLDGDLAMDVRIESTNNGGAEALYGGYDLTVNSLSGAVTAVASGGGAYGIEANEDLTINLLSGTVSATTGGTVACGVRSGEYLTINALTGTVSATAGRNTAYGVYSRLDMTIDLLSGTVSATAGGDGAFGIYSGITFTDGSGGAVDISGTVSAQADGFAAAVAVNGGMNLYVTGTLSAKDTSGSGKAYAIAAGYWTSGSWHWNNLYDDTVVLGSGASITGDINLAGGTNILTLQDAGTLIGDVTNIDTMTKTGSGAWSVDGSISTGSLAVDDGTLKVGVSQSASATVQASGTVTNNGEIQFSLDGRIVAGTFTALSGAALAGAGTYTTDSLFLTAAVNGSNVDLTKRTFSDVLGGSQLATALDANYATAGDELYALISAIEQSSTQAEASAAMDQLTSLLLLQSADISVGAARLTSSATQMRMAEMRSYQNYLASKDRMDPDDPSTWPTVAALGDLSGLLNRSPESDPNGLYLRAIGRTGEMDSHGGYSGYDYDSVLFSGGYDRVVRDHLLLGVSAGYSFTGAEYKDSGSSTSDLDSYSLGLYASLFHEAWYLDMVLSGTYNAYDLDRELPALGMTASADPDGWTLTAKTEGGHRFAMGNWGLTPKASLEYTRFHQDGYTETGAGAANLIINDTDSDYLESGLGGTIDHTWETSWGMVIPELSAMWLHEWMEQDRDITYAMTGLPGTVFSQTMAEQADDALRLGAGLRFVLDSGLVLTARYQGELEEHGRSHSILFEAQWLF